LGARSIFFTGDLDDIAVDDATRDGCSRRRRAGARSDQDGGGAADVRLRARVPVSRRHAIDFEGG
jgi:hypothetical protein